MALYSSDPDFICQNERLMSWANDASRFLKTYHRECQSQPLDVYYHFAFTPKSTIFQRVYSKIRSFPHPVVTIGLEDDWPSHTKIKTHRIVTHCLSPCGNWLATGGSRGSYAAYRIWDVALADGETSVHPCGEKGCTVQLVLWSYDQDHQPLLQTICKCKILFRWNLSTYPHTLLDEIKLDFKREYSKWSEDGSRALTYDHHNDSDIYSLWSRDSPQSYFQMPGSYRTPYRYLAEEHKCSFSPGSGDKLEHHMLYTLKLWDCIGMQELFSKSFNMSLEYVQFSPNGETLVLLVGHYYMSQSIHCSDMVPSGANMTPWHAPGQRNS
ncbi:3025_t:CDS:1 [Acaulospora colombiana]|uniref:3025_t:CDS:1 n=1 Tax=Acaulospora colombiana TaxID=27376 RepID=A0ACA9QC76_9GLOM|nr:3025_t:CDS:1 [Acaulospora colombiana]